MFCGPIKIKVLMIKLQSLPASLGMYWHQSAKTWGEAKSAMSTGFLSFTVLKIRLNDRKSIEGFLSNIDWFFLQFAADSIKYWWPIHVIINTVDKTILPCNTPHLHSTKVSSETYPFKEARVHFNIVCTVYGRRSSLYEWSCTSSITWIRKLLDSVRLAWNSYLAFLLQTPGIAKQQMNQLWSFAPNHPQVGR